MNGEEIPPEGLIVFIISNIVPISFDMWLSFQPIVISMDHQFL